MTEENFDIFNVDLNSVQEAEQKDFSAAKPGVAHVRITEVEAKQSSTGNPGLRVKYEITNAESLEPVTPNALISKYLGDWISLTQGALPFLKNFVNAFGIDFASVSASRDWSSIVGLEGDVKLGIETYNGKTRNTIDRYVTTVNK